MGTPRLTGFLISIVLVGFFMGILGMYFVNISENYPPSVAYDNSSLEIYNKMDNMTTRAEQYQDKVTELKTDTNIIDIVGAFFSSAYSSLLVVVDSFDLFKLMADRAVLDLTGAGLGSVANLFKIMIQTVLLLVIFVGIIMAVVLKRDKI